MLKLKFCLFLVQLPYMFCQNQSDPAPSLVNSNQVLRLQVCGCSVGTTLSKCNINLACIWGNNQCNNISLMSSLTDTSHVVIISPTSNSTSSSISFLPNTTSTNMTTSLNSSSNTTANSTSSTPNQTSNSTINITSNSNTTSMTSNSSSNQTTNNITNSTSNITSNITSNSTQNSTNVTANSTNTSNQSNSSILNQTSSSNEGSDEGNYDLELYYINLKITLDNKKNLNTIPGLIMNQTNVTNNSSPTMKTNYANIPLNFALTAKCVQQYDYSSCIEKRWPNSVFCIWQNNTCVNGACSDLTNVDCENTFFCVEYGLCMSCLPIQNFAGTLSMIIIFILTYFTI